MALSIALDVLLDRANHHLADLTPPISCAAPPILRFRLRIAATLFIDKGCGSLDAAAYDLTIDALETLQSQSREVGVISHVEAMMDRIPPHIAVRKQGGGKYVIAISAPSGISTLPIAY